MLASMRGRHGRLLAAAIVIPLVTHRAEAQIINWPPISASPNKPVYEQPRPEYDQPGIDLRSFLFKPSFFEDVTYDDSIFASDIHHASDLINTTGEELSFDSQWSRHHLSVDLQSTQQIYTQHPEESANTYLATIEGRYDIGADAYLEIDGNGGQKPQIRASQEAFQPSGHRPIYNVWVGNVTYFQRVGNLVNEFRAAFNQNAYIYPQNIYQSNTDKIIGDRLSFDYGQICIPFVEAGYDMNFQVFHPEIQDFTNLTGLIGVQAHIDSLIDAEMSAGFLRETYSNHLFQPQLAPIIEGKLLWNITPLTSISANLFFDYSGVESFCNTGLVCQIDSKGNKEPVSGADPPGQSLFSTHRSSVQRQISSVAVQHELWHDLLGQVQAGYQHYAYDFNGLTDNYYVMDADLRFLVNAYAEVQASYEYRVRSANQPLDLVFNTGPFNESIISLKIVAQR